MHVIVLTGSQIFSTAQCKMFFKALAEIANYSKYCLVSRGTQQKSYTFKVNILTSIFSALLSIKQTQKGENILRHLLTDGTLKTCTSP